MLSRKNREVFLLSLRVLAETSDGLSPSRRDVIVLRRNAREGEGDLPVDELCCRLVRREVRITEPAMTEDEVSKIKKLAGQVLHLSHLRDRRCITEVEYIALLNAVRKEHGLWLIRSEGQASHR